MQSGLRSSTRRLPAGTLAAFLVAVSCSGDGGTEPGPDTTPAAVAIASGQSQSGQVDASLPQPFVVRVTNASSEPLSGVTVSWSILEGGGMLSSGSSTTNAQGNTQVSYTLGPNAGTNRVQATVQGTNLSVTFMATASAPPTDLVPASIAIASGNNQSTPVGTALANPLVVVVRNAGSEALSGVAVDWVVTAGGGTLDQSTSSTNGAGQAANQYTVGTTIEANTIEASVQSDPSLTVSFTANATAASGAVEVGDNFFDPGSLTVLAGATVEWTWIGAASHNVTFDAGGPNSATQTTGTFSRTFASTGSFTYYCTVHGRAAMSGTVVVQ